MTPHQHPSRRHLRFGMLGAACALGLALVVSAASLAAAGSFGPAAPAHPVRPVQPQSLIVTTDKGQVEGRTTGTVDQWLGIPYAQPPTGALRWAPPKAVTPWAGVRSALSYGGRCAQLASGNGPRIDNEDCLYVNVYAPSVIPAGKKLPVLFMIHGGGLTTGAGDQQDGSLLVAVGRHHRRVGQLPARPVRLPLLPGLSSTVPDGNFGLLDQETALGGCGRTSGRSAVTPPRSRSPASPRAAGRSARCSPHPRRRGCSPGRLWKAAAASASRRPPPRPTRSPSPRPRAARPPLPRRPACAGRTRPPCCRRAPPTSRCSRRAGRPSRWRRSRRSHRGTTTGCRSCSARTTTRAARSRRASPRSRKPST